MQNKRKSLYICIEVSAKTNDYRFTYTRRLKGEATQRATPKHRKIINKLGKTHEHRSISRLTQKTNDNRFAYARRLKGEATGKATPRHR